MTKVFATKKAAVEAVFGTGRVTAVRHIAGKVWEYRSVGSYGYLQRAEFSFDDYGAAHRGDRLYHVYREKIASTGSAGSLGFVVTEGDPEFLETVTGRRALEHAKRRHQKSGWLVDASNKWDRFKK